MPVPGGGAAGRAVAIADDTVNKIGVALWAASAAWLVSSCLLYVAVEVLLRRLARAKES